MSRNITEYIQAIVDCGLMSAANIESFCQRLPPEKRPKTPTDLARELVQADRLTKYQATEAYQGRGAELRIGNYLILDRIGQGGMGQVFRARHSRMDRIVAIKVLSRESLSSPDSVERFQREAKAAARVVHPNMVTAYDADEAGGIHFLVMEYIPGLNLDTQVKRHGPMPVDEALRAMLEAARGLQCAHQAGIVHRDIKPSNLLRDESGTLKILDLGLALLSKGPTVNSVDVETRITQSGHVMGTADYMAPEQSVDASTADVRSDVYSLGCTLFYLLTGKPPYSGKTVVALVLAHHRLPVPSVRAARPEVPPGVDQVVKRMMAKSPAERYQTMTEVTAALEGCRDGATTEKKKPAKLVKARPMPTPPPITKPEASPKLSRRMGLIAGGVAAAFVVVGLAVWLLRGSDSPQLVEAPPAQQPSKPTPQSPSETVPKATTSTTEPSSPEKPPAASAPSPAPAVDPPPVATPPAATPPVPEAAASPTEAKPTPAEAKSVPDPAKPAPDQVATNTPAAIVPPKVPAPEPAVPKPASPATPSRIPTELGSPVDLLSPINLYRDAAVGSWERGTEGALRCDASTMLVTARLQLPVDVPAQYVLSAEVTRMDGSGPFYLGFLAGGRQGAIMFHVDKKGSPVNLVELAERNSKVNSDKGHLPVGKPVKIRCAVLEDEIVVEMDGQELIDWQGSFKQFTLPKALRCLPNPRSVFVAMGESSFEIRRLELYPIGGSEGADPRRPVPALEEQARAEIALRKALEKSYAGADSAAGKVALLKDLFFCVDDPDIDATQAYVAGCEARDGAVTLQDLPNVKRAIMGLAGEYRVDSSQLLAEALEKMLQSTPPPPVAKGVVRACLRGIDQALDDRQFETAERLTTLAQTAVRRTSDPALTKLVTERFNELKALKPLWEKADAAYQRLAADPHDAEANLAVGKYLCFGRDAWEAGLPYLAQGSDQELAELAARSIKPGLPTEELVALADAWWDRWIKSQSADKAGMQAGAGYWYLFVQPRVAGTAKTRVQQRLTTLLGKRPIPPGQARIERQAAEWVLDLGGQITIQQPGTASEQSVSKNEDLPATSFAVVAIDLEDNPLVLSQGLEKIHALRFIRKLNFNKTLISDAGLIHLRDLVSLTDLEIVGPTKSPDAASLTGAGLIHLQGLVHLQTISCDGNRLYDGWGVLKKCPITELKVFDQIDDQALAQIATLKGLKKLEIIGGAAKYLTNSGLASLADLPQLEWVNLKSSNIGDAGLQHLTKIKSLKWVGLGNTKATPAGVQQLKSALPGCEVSYTNK